MLTQATLKQLLDYDPNTGIFIWKVNKGSARKGNVAGHEDNLLRYMLIAIDGRLYKAHRLAWLYVHGQWPTQHIDHINGDPKDNRIINLRDVSSRDNQNNLKCHRNGKLPGTSYFKRDDHWQAYIRIDGKKIHLGCCDSEKEAHEKYLEARLKYGV